MDKRKIRAAKLKIVGEVYADLRAMQRMRKINDWLIQRDSNCGLAGCLCDAIDVLIRQAETLHREEHANWLKEVGK